VYKHLKYKEMAFISISYSEPETSSYRSVNVSLISGEKLVFDSGDFMKDWYFALKYLVNLENWEPISYSSSVDHFIMDGAPYDSAYFRVEVGSGVGVLDFKESKEGIEIFVKSGWVPSWEEFRSYCNN
jgi:hypothetical protein